MELRSPLAAVLLVAAFVVGASMAGLAGCAGGDIDDENSNTVGGDIGNGGGLDAGPSDGGETDTDGDVDAEADGGAPSSECEEDGECTGEDEVCDLYDGVCVDACENSEDCGEGACRFSTGHCLECADDPDCGEQEVCDDAAEPPVCRECMIDLDCPGELVCTGEFECVECLDHAVCPGPFTPFCDVEANMCVRCAEDGQCPPGQVCDLEGDDCVECLDDGDCPEEYECDEANLCSGCEDHEECPDGFCRESDSVCVECYEHEHCTGEKDLCDTDEDLCRECLVNGDCDTGEVCVPEYDLEKFRIVHFCADCETDLHCVEEDYPHCSGDYECQECVIDAHCEGGQTCSASGTCS